VQKTLESMGMKFTDIGLVIITTHAHSDHIEAVQLFNNTEALSTIHKDEWKFFKKKKNFIDSVLIINIDAITPNFFSKPFSNRAIVSRVRF
jgi:metal-dependent hydrolase (beta-lactamase superfamily II)